MFYVIKISNVRGDLTDMGANVYSLVRSGIFHLGPFDVYVGLVVYIP